MASLSSPPPSPLFARSASSGSRSSSNTYHMPLSISNVANVLVKMRRHRNKVKAHHIDSASGDAPLTHPALAGEGAVSARRVPLMAEDVTFVCRDGVDVSKLLRAARAAVYQSAVEVGANVLVDERWTSTICGPRHRSDGTFRVHIVYTASGARSDKRDPQRPVALENVRDVPGLMTIIDRLD